MHEPVVERNSEGVSNDAHAFLVSMGFQASDVQNALDMYGNAQDAINSLLSSGYASEHGNEEDVDVYYDVEEASLFTFSNDDIKWYLATAQCVAESYGIDRRSGLLCQEELNLVSWANDLLEKADMIQDYADEHTCTNESPGRQRTVQLCLQYNELAKKLGDLYEKRRDKSEENLAAVKKVVRNKRRERDQCYGEGLEGLLNHSDQVREETHQLREIVLSFTRPPFGMNETTFEEIYLFIKEFVHNDEDLNSKFLQWD